MHLGKEFVRNIIIMVIQLTVDAIDEHMASNGCFIILEGISTHKCQR